MMKLNVEESPLVLPRILGAAYSLYFLAAFSEAFLMKGLLVASDAAATASSISAHAALFRSGLALDLIANALYIAVTALLYRLLSPVGRNVALIAAFFGIAGCAVQIFGNIFRFAVLVILQNNDWLAPFNAEQLHAAVLMCLKLHAQAFNSSLVLFAFFDLLIGYLIFRSTLLPRALGALLMISGLGWLTFLWPPLAAALASYILPLGALAEFLLMLWLLIRGANSMGSKEGA